MEALVYLLIGLAALGGAAYFAAALAHRWAAPRLGAASAGYRARPSVRRNYAQRS